MSQPENKNASQESDLVQAKTLLNQAIVMLSRNSKGVSAAHAQMALDMLEDDSSRLDPRLPD
jgi:hypothetical protein